MSTPKIQRYLAPGHWPLLVIILALTFVAVFSLHLATSLAAGV